MNKNIFKNKNKGAVAIILTLLIMGLTLLIALGLSIIFVNEIKNSSLVSKSASAFYAADAGAEYALYQIFKAPVRRPSGTDSKNLYGSALYNVCWGNSCTPGCSGAPNCINSSGTYSQTKRRVELTWGL